MNRPGLKEGFEPKHGGKLSTKTLMGMVGIGLTAGVAVIAAADKIMKAATSKAQEEKCCGQESCERER